MRLLITGGTGTLGQAIVRSRKAGGLKVRVQSRRARTAAMSADVEWATAELATGEGLRAACEGVDAIVHAASDPRNAHGVDVRGTELLVDAARSAGIGHIVYISIVGIDRIPFP
jgi:nucleoside-diphosphate-sugar epimerase